VKPASVKIFFPAASMPSLARIRIINSFSIFPVFYWQH
jgi:hypothetical protein